MFYNPRPASFALHDTTTDIFFLRSFAFGRWLRWQRAARRVGTFDDDVDEKRVQRGRKLPDDDLSIKLGLNLLPNNSTRTLKHTRASHILVHHARRRGRRWQIGVKLGG